MGERKTQQQQQQQEKLCHSLCTFTVLKLLGVAMWFVTIGQIRW